MPLIHSRRAPVDPQRPLAIGYCDRCQFEWYLKDLKDQKEWSGFSLVSTGLLVCDGCLDEPTPWKKTLIIGPEPKPLKNPRPTAPHQGPIPAQFQLDHSLLDGDDPLSGPAVYNPEPIQDFTFDKSNLDGDDRLL